MQPCNRLYGSKISMFYNEQPSLNFGNISFADDAWTKSIKASGALYSLYCISKKTIIYKSNF